MRSAAFSPPPAPAGRPHLPTRNGFRFVWLHGSWAGSDQCGRAPSIPAHGAVIIAGCLTCLVCLVQVYEVGGGDLRRVADFGGAFAAEIEGWVAEKRVYDVLWGAAQPARILCRGVARWLGGRRL